MILPNSTVKKVGNTCAKSHRTLMKTTFSVTRLKHHPTIPYGLPTLHEIKDAHSGGDPAYDRSPSPLPTTPLQQRKPTYSSPSSPPLMVSPYPTNGKLPSITTHQKLPGDRKMISSKVSCKTHPPASLTSGVISPARAVCRFAEIPQHLSASPPLQPSLGILTVTSSHT